jgi:hypothetical protein
MQEASAAHSYMDVVVRLSFPFRYISLILLRRQALSQQSII